MLVLERKELYAKDKEIVKALEKQEKNAFGLQQKSDKNHQKDLAVQERKEKLQNRMNKIVKLEGRIPMMRMPKKEIKQKKTDKQPSKEEMDWLRYLGNLEKEQE